jgi:multidrug efflux pump
MFSRFFIDRPIFASVLSIVITLVGGISVFKLGLAQYPTVAPPTVRVRCSYPGASSQVVSETVASPIEQQVNGVENMIYMSSQCTNDGSYDLAVTFKPGVDLNMAQVLVQNRVNLAIPSLPEVLRQTGITTRKLSPDMLMTVSINSPTGKDDQPYLSNYAMLKIRDELSRLPGVGDVFITGQRDYSMRIWVDPDRLAARHLTAGDVVAAVREQNMQVACGQIGQPPVHRGQPIQVTLSTLGRLVDPEQFANIVIHTAPDGRLIRIKDIGRVELGARNVDVQSHLDGKDSVGLMISQLPDANALEVADSVHKKIAELAQDFPKGMIYEIQYDTTPYTRECIYEVVKSLRDAVLLVAFVVLLFLQNWRSAVIPLVTVPVAIVGTFAVMLAMGFTLNNLTLFGLVLAIGIVVDDAIVVVEAVEHHIEQGLSPREATIKAMSQVSSPVVAVGLVLSAVFVPCAFISGITGQFFRQFALTIATSTILSAFNSLTLSPALAAILLKPRKRGEHNALPPLFCAAVAGWAAYRYLGPWLGARVMQAGMAAPWVAAAAGGLAGWFAALPVNYLLGWFFRAFNATFLFGSRVYTWLVGRLLRVVVLVLMVYVGLLYLAGWSFRAAPKGFIPTQDMGYLQIDVQMPDTASAERTRAVMDRVQEIVMHEPGVKHTLGVAGRSFLLSANSSEFGSMQAILDDFSDRRSPELYSEVIANRLQEKCLAAIPDAAVTVLAAPPLRGIGRAGGFKLMIEDRGDAGLKTLQGQTDNIIEKAGQLRRASTGRPLLVRLKSVFRANATQLFADVNRRQCMALGVPLNAVFNSLQVYLGSFYANDFNLFGRTWQVVVQAEAEFRNRVEKIRQLKVRNNGGTMVPLGTVADIREVNGPLILTRYNMYPAAAVQGAPGPGVSSRQAIDLMQQLADRELLSSMHYEWTEMAYLELQAGNTAMVIFGLAVAMVFLVLAAQYESWSLPLAVILTVPMCLLGAVMGVLIRQMEINIFTQIGFVVLVGLASKNAILIVEFAKRQRESGVTAREAAITACRLRLRPIVMTSFSFILGVSPLMIAVGAGAEIRRALGTAVFSGMLGVTIFGIFLTPVFFTAVDRLSTTGLFRIHSVQIAGGILIFLLTLGIPWTVRRLQQRRGRPAATAEPRAEEEAVAGSTDSSATVP